ncbi:hypothetical protein [uncultured Methylobacterium sp.]|uniref:hypothetical protein n=1 Tax=uncultured Methylobacterium sp. TaxID=157278 RepID=UPI0035CA5724
MNARDETHGAEAPGAARDFERRQMEQAEPCHGFRPLALPALAAAAQLRKAAVKPDLAPAERRGILAIVHEDAPLV